MVGRLLLGLQSRVLLDDVGVIVGSGGGVLVLGRGVERLTLVVPGGFELRSGAAFLQAERQEWLRCCPPTSLRLGL